MNACLAGKNTNFFLWDFSLSLVIIAVKNLKTTLYHHTTKIWSMYWKNNSKCNVFCVCWFLHSSEIWNFGIFLLFRPKPSSCHDRRQFWAFPNVSFFLFWVFTFLGFFNCSISGPKTECLFGLFALLKSRFCNLRGVIIC